MARFTIWATFAMMLMVQYSVATTRYVGSCKVSTGFFSTITDAVNASNPSGGDTVAVCPGTYNEQVKISIPLTLQGLSSHGSSQVLINGGTNPTATSSTVLGTQFAPAVWVTSTGVNIKNILAANVPNDGFCGSGVGVYYASGSSGTLTEVASGGCGLANIWVENSSSDIQGVTIENSLIGGGTYGIVAASKQPAGTIPVLGATLTGNQIQSTVYGIYLYAVGGTISGNFITSNGQSGFTGPAPATYGIWDAAPASVTGNTILDGSTVATAIKIAVANASVTNNFVTSAGNIAIDFSCFAATNVTGNTINAEYGIYRVPSTFTGTNTFFSTLHNRTGGC